MNVLLEQAPWFVLGVAFAFGAVVGSFLNVVIARLPAGESVVHPRSRCPRCKTPIAWYDNVPVLSWLVLRARCRTCGLPISSRYPLIELLTAVLFAAVIRRYGLTAAGGADLVFTAALVALAWIDLDTWWLPEHITMPLLALGLVSPLWNPDVSWLSSVAGAGIGFSLFAAIALVGEKLLEKETMGWGDVWLLAGIGAWLGAPALLPVILLSSVQGAVVGIALLLAGKRPADRELPPQPEGDDWKPPPHAVPFGPFLALGAIEVLLLGDTLVALWGRLLGAA